MTREERTEKLKELFGKGATLNKIAYWHEPRKLFEIIYSNLDELCNLYPDKAQELKELCETESEQYFLAVLETYQTDEDKKRLWVHRSEDGHLYLV